MFEPRPPLEFKAKANEHKHDASYSGVSRYTSLFEATPPPPPAPFVQPVEKKKLMKEKLIALNKERNDLLAADWDPNSNPRATE
jgi:hypothetical protein